MSNPVPEIMQNPRLKVKRANKHIASLLTDCAALPHDLYEIANGPARSIAVLRNPDCFDLSYRPKEPINEHFGAVVGDAVNNLREALDYWINNAVLWRTNVRGKLHFPFAEERKNLKTTRNYLLIERAFPELAAKILNEIEPCRDTNLYLWAVTSLCNKNKHNDFLPVVTIGITDNFFAETEGCNTFTGGIIKHDANNNCIFIRSGYPIKLKKDLRFSTEITFPKGAVFENQPVIPTLVNMAQVVSETLDVLEEFISTV